MAWRIGISALTLLLGACGSDTSKSEPVPSTGGSAGSGGAGASSGTAGTGGTGAAATLETHRCITPGATAVTDWGGLKNPILEYPTAAVKDVSVRHVDGRWRLAFSYIVDNPFRFRIGLLSVTSLGDLASSPEPELWDDPSVGGLASPDITRSLDGDLVVAFNSHTNDIGESKPKLYYRRGTSLEEMGGNRRLGSGMYEAEDDRLIDSALAHTSSGFLLGFKLQQISHLAWSSSLDGPWTDLGVPSFFSAENYQFFTLGGHWKVLLTRLSDHKPVLYSLRADEEPPAPSGAELEPWLDWDVERELEIPEESWNQEEPANAAFLCDARESDGYFYLFYAGSNELDAYNGRGHAKIGIARSANLESWEVP